MKTFNDYEELGKALKQANPQKFGAYGDDKMLGYRYARKNPDRVRVKGFVEAYQTQDFDVGEIASNLLPSTGELALDTVKGAADIVGQVFDPDVSVLKSLASLAGGGADVLGRKVGLDLDLGTQEAEDMASLMGEEVAQSLTPARINKDPATALANAALAVSGPLRGAALGARGAAGLSKSGALGKAASGLGKVADYADKADPINLGASVTTKLGRKGVDKVKSGLKSITRSDKSLGSEYVDEFFGFPTSAGGRAVSELRDLTEGGKGSELRKWRNMERGELYDKLFNETTNAVKAVNKKAEQAYTKAMASLRPLMEKDYPQMDQLKSSVIQSLKDEFGDGIKITPVTRKANFKKNVTDFAESPQEKTVYSGYTVSFGDGSGVLPEYRSQISKEIEEVLNWGNKSGTDIHDWRKALDKNISRMPGPTDFRGDTTPSAAAFTARTTLRKALSSNLKRTYDGNDPSGPYSRAMAEYHDIADLQRDMSNIFSVSGTNFDKVKKETIVAELANSYNPNARQYSRPDLLKKLEKYSGNENVRTGVVAGIFNPFVSKGLAQRSEYAGLLRALATGAAGGFLFTGEPIIAAVGALSAVPLQALYNPRIASEVIIRKSAPQARGNLRKANDLLSGWFAGLPKEAKDFIKQLPPNTPLQRGLERLASEYGLQLTDVNAEEGTKGQRRLLKTLGSAGIPNPSR